MMIYTIVESEESFTEPLTVKVVGSNLLLPFARESLVNHIVERAQEDAAFSYSLWNDANHGEEFRDFMRGGTAREDIASYFDREKGKMRFPDDVVHAMCSYLLGCVAGEDGMYHIYEEDAEQVVHFDIIGNELSEGVTK